MTTTPRPGVGRRHVTAFGAAQALCAVLVALPGDDTVTGAGLALSALVAALTIVFATRAAPPPRPRVWHLLAAALTACAGGWAWWAVQPATAAAAPDRAGGTDVLL